MSELSWKEAIIRVLTTAAEPMHYAEISDAIAEKGLRTNFGATPANTIICTILSSIEKDGERSPFVKVSKGHYALKEKSLIPGGDEPEVEPGDETDETGLIKAFGMYWRRDKVLWTSTPQLLGQQQPGSAPVDFASEKGVYLLYDGREVVYVGRITKDHLGNRLKYHTIDRLNGRWDRFSWFGVYAVTEDGRISTTTDDSFSLENLIVTMEALLIEGLEPPQNRKRGDEFRAVEYLQVEDPEIQKTQIVQLMDELKKKL